MLVTSQTFCQTNLLEWVKKNFNIKKRYITITHIRKILVHTQHINTQIQGAFFCCEFEFFIKCNFFTHSIKLILEIILTLPYKN